MYTWKIIEPLLYGLVGASINFRVISATFIIEGVYMAVIGIGVRLTATFVLMTLTMIYTRKERAFMSIANLPRSSLQASLGPQLLTFIHSKHITDQATIDQGIRVLTITVVFEIIIAPIGAVLSGSLAPILLRRKHDFANIIMNVKKI